jgi:hypothetical protein
MQLPQTLIDIALAGGGLDIDAGGLLPDTMKTIAAAAAKSKLHPRIVFRNVGKVLMLPDMLVAIAAAGQGCVQFEM